MNTVNRINGTQLKILTIIAQEIDKTGLPCSIRTVSRLSGKSFTSTRYNVLKLLDKGLVSAGRDDSGRIIQNTLRLS